MKKLIALAAGGTGGHVFPAQALAEALTQKDYHLILLTDRRGENLPARLQSLESFAISSGAISGRGRRAKLASALQLGWGVLQALGVLLRRRPAAVVGFGGYPSVPPLIAARLLGIPTILHEQNAVIGRANRLLAPLCKALGLSFEKTRALPPQCESRSYWVGNPIRPDIAALAQQQRPQQELAPNPASFEILVTGGSQGAQLFGDIVPQAIAKLPVEWRKQLRLYQQVRPDQIAPTQAFYETIAVNATVSSFFADMPERLARADLMIARAGASSIAEIAVAGIPSIIIPYEKAIDDHQTANAARLCDAGGAWMIAEADFTVANLAARLEKLIQNRQLLTTAALAARRLGISDAGARLARLVCHIAEQQRGAPDLQPAFVEKDPHP